MVKKALIIFACLTAIIIVVSIIVSIVNSKPLEYQSVVAYDKNTMAMKPAPVYANVDDASDDIPLLSDLIRHDRLIMISSIFVVLLFALLFYGAKRSKS